MLALAPLKEEKPDDMETEPLPAPVSLPYTLKPLDQDEMEVLTSIKQETEKSTRDRLVDSLAASYPSGALAKVFRDADENDPLSASCFASIRLDKGRIDEGFDSDDELTSLSWLQDGDLLRGMRVGSECGSPCGDEEAKENEGGFQSGYYGQPHPPHVPYNPQKHINSKPPYSFSCLIFMAIEDNPDKKLPVKDIYNWILTHFPYFQNAPTGWKNSVRHNLSLNKCFKKVEKDRCSNIGKGSLWMIDPDFRPNLLQALRKTPYHPYHQLQMFSNVSSNLCTLNNGLQKPLPLQPRYNINSPSPHLFPFLSRRLAQSNFVSNGTGSANEVVDLVSDIDVANTLVSLKRAAESRRPRRRRRSSASSCSSASSRGSRSPSPPEFGSEREKEMLQRRKQEKESPEKREVVVFVRPSADHSYCVTAEQLEQQQLQQRGAMSPESSIDEEYEFGANDKSTSEVEDEIFSESDYDEEGWSEEEELYERERLKLYSKAPLILAPPTTTQQRSTGSQASQTNYTQQHGRITGSTRKMSHVLISPTSRRTSIQQAKGSHQQSPQKALLFRNKGPTVQVVKVKRDPDEDLKIAEGANALLNLAGIRSATIVPMRRISPNQAASINNNNDVNEEVEVKREEEDMEA